jgi:hypothetical protein
MVSSEGSAWDVPPSIFGTRSGGPTVQRLVLLGGRDRQYAPVTYGDMVLGTHRSGSWVSSTLPRRPG